MTEDEIRASAVRETAAYIDRIHKIGLVPLGTVLADMAAAAYRMEQGMTARGSMRAAGRCRDSETAMSVDAKNEQGVEHLTGHHPCQVQGHHMCSKPSGRRCVDCGAAAGTMWGPYWCMDCDSRRLERISGQFDALLPDVEIRSHREL